MLYRTILAAIVAIATCQGLEAFQSQGVKDVDRSIASSVFGGTCTGRSVVADSIDQCESTPTCYEEWIGTDCFGHCVTCSTNPNDKLISGSDYGVWSSVSKSCGAGFQKICPAVEECVCTGTPQAVACGYRISYEKTSSCGY